MPNHPVVSREAWLDARRALLAREKEYSRLRDALAAERRALPWVRIEKPYRFETPKAPGWDGATDLAGLFRGHGQLIVYHFMLAPGWEAGCTGCSFGADHFDGMLPHLENHDVSFVAVSRAPLPEIERYRRRMGWRFPWVSSHGSDFNADFHVTFTPEQLASGTVFYNFRQTPSQQAHDELHGLSVFCRDAEGTVFHTYSAYARGTEDMLTTFLMMDLTPKGRDENGTMNWVRRHDEYAALPPASCCG
ncbi:DUF899 domain-containing protein [Teichococcus oryzae]|uniref:DUF899 domain-containing protein n=1 Tax=Teichococcus oryzae TaxID=1608942 RepID=A0A5B2TIL7_9PROT|nr:thioredoxin family protein [Pseudoroseomonas oryzae]KAA2213845.1 DUF899 domain-containing protein [Pseudoroseomonas oryzae]